MKYIQKLIIASAMIFSLNTGLAMTCPAPDTIHHHSDGRWTLDDAEWEVDTYGYNDGAWVDAGVQNISFVEAGFYTDRHQIMCAYEVDNSHIEVLYKKLLDVDVMVEYAKSDSSWMLIDGDTPYCSGAFVSDCEF